MNDRKLNNSRPTLPSDMDLIASSPNLTTLVERHNSISSVRTNNTDRTQRQALRTQPPVQQQVRTQTPVQQQVRTQPPVQQQPQVLQPQIHPSQLQQQQQQQRPISHQNIQPTTNGSSEWRRNTMNNIKLQEVTQTQFIKDNLIKKKKIRKRKNLKLQQQDTVLCVDHYYLTINFNRLYPIQIWFEDQKMYLH